MDFRSTAPCAQAHEYIMIVYIHIYWIWKFRRHFLCACSFYIILTQIPNQTWMRKKTRRQKITERLMDYVMCYACICDLFYMCFFWFVRLAIMKFELMQRDARLFQWKHQISLVNRFSQIEMIFFSSLRKPCFVWNIFTFIVRRIISSGIVNITNC